MSSINTKCVQGGYTPGNGEPRQIPIIQSTTFKYDTSEAMGRLLIWRIQDIFIQDCRIQPTILWQLRSLNWKVVRRLCLLLPARLQTSLLCLTSVSAEATL